MLPASFLERERPLACRKNLSIRQFIKMSRALLPVFLALISLALWIDASAQTNAVTVFASLSASPLLQGSLPVAGLSASSQSATTPSEAYVLEQREVDSLAVLLGVDAALSHPRDLRVDRFEYIAGVNVLLPRRLTAIHMHLQTNVQES